MSAQVNDAVGDWHNLGVFFCRGRLGTEIAASSLVWDQFPSEVLAAFLGFKRQTDTHHSWPHFAHSRQKNCCKIAKLNDTYGKVTVGNCVCACVCVDDRLSSQELHCAALQAQGDKIELRL